MKMLDIVATWLAPSRELEIASAEAGVKAARERLKMVESRDPAIAQTVQSHQLDRNRNHYGERIMNALRGAL